MSAEQFLLPGIEPASMTPPGHLDYWRVGGLDGRVGMFRGYDGKDMVVLLFPDGSMERFYPHQLFPAPDWKSNNEKGDATNERERNEALSNAVW